MTEDDFYGELEQEDATCVDRASMAIGEGRFADAERELLKVIAHAPPRYEYRRDILDSASALSTRAAGGYDCEHDRGWRRCIKWWDKKEFEHYVRWQEFQRTPHSMLWLKAAYPPAYFYLAVISLERRDPTTALDYLNRGTQLEPNPKFVLECAAACYLMGRSDEALQAYSRCKGVSLRVQPDQVACAARGTAFILIEAGALDDAERVLQGLLVHDPGDVAAQGELRYIAELRAGAPRRPPVFRLSTLDGRAATPPTDVR